MIFVKGTGDAAYSFGEREKINISIADFCISKYPVTQRLWEYIAGSNPSRFNGQNRPVECVSFNDITSDKGFLDKLNASNGSKFNLRNDISFRLPSETEWEYAARGGTHWRDGFPFSGSNNLSEAGWYEQNSGKITDPALLHRLKNTEKGTETHDVGLKAPNQLGIYDMSGNVWEWCQDDAQDDIFKIPKDGTPHLSGANERILRGGCHHNWDIHCTVSKRYSIALDAKDECIGFRIAAST
ncbi:formylglycine-generating enzyme family protein [Parapedobacter sp. DT-150]|uniref:formylglycine-generating enzyme family protein n=1 Tax=Parapedobacter sp. DT-150 TaxID=3396162 RepID=UPI003F1975B7